MAAASNGSRPGWSSASTTSKEKLEVRFPVHTSWELTLQNEETVEGRVYCTDEASQTVVLQSDLTHTTLASEMRIIHASSVVRAVQKEEGESNGTTTTTTPLSAQLPKVQKKALEEREKRAIRMAEESLRHINQKVCICGWPERNHYLILHE